MFSDVFRYIIGLYRTKKLVDLEGAFLQMAKQSEVRRARKRQVLPPPGDVYCAFVLIA